MEERIVKNTFGRFFMPTLTASVTLSVISMTDLIIAGRFVGEEALTSISLALPVIIFVQIIGAFLGTGGAIVLSTRLGEGKLEECSRIFSCAMAGALLIGILVSVAGTVFLEPIILLCGGSYGEVMEGAKAYMGTLFYGMTFMILSPIMMTYLRNDNEQQYSMVCVVTSGLFNIVFSYSFAVLFGLGIRGIALATVLSQLLTCILGSLKLFRKNRTFHLVKFRLGGGLLFSILRPGFPVAAIFLSQVILTMVINKVLMSAGGSEGVAVYAVIKYLINFMYALFDGVTGAIQPMLGIYFGERERSNIRHTVKYSLAAMLAISGGMFLAMELLGTPLCRLFGVESGSLTGLTVHAMRIEAICCLTAGCITYVNAFYRCTGNASVSFALSIADNFVFPIFWVLVLARGLGLGVSGVWWGLAAGGLSTLLCWFVYCLKEKRGFLLLREEQFVRPEGEYHVIHPATSEQMEILLPEVEEVCDSMDIPMKKQYYISLAIEELVANVVGLAQTDARRKKKKEYYVDIRISPRENGEVELRIRDNLTEFNPGEVATDDMSSLLQGGGESAVNTLGIGMVKKIASEYSYKRTIGFNNFSVILP